MISVVKGDMIALEDQGVEVLRIAETMKDDVVEICLDGSMKNDTAFALEDELKTLALLNKNIILDMGKITYLSNACCQALLVIQQTIDNNETGSLKLKNIPERIYADMRSVGLTDLLLIEDPKEK